MHRGAVGKNPASLECAMGRDSNGPGRVLMDMGEVGAHVTSSSYLIVEGVHLHLSYSKYI